MLFLYMKTSLSHHNRLEVESIDEDPIALAAREHFGIHYLFPYQRLVISNILEGAGYFDPGTQDDPDGPVDAYHRQIAILPTGAGKSLCFMLPGVLLDGITIILFPLLSLMSDQKRRLEEQEISAELLRGGQTAARRKAAWQQLESGESRFLLSNPETLTSPQALRRLSKLRINHVVIDEAHTLPMWGKEFRPALLRIPELIEACKPKMISAFTATASDTVLADIQKILFPDEAAHVIRANPDRPNISYHVIESLCKLFDLRRLLDPEYRYCLPRPALVFCSTRIQSQRCAMYLRNHLRSRDIYFYHAGLEREEKQRVQEWFLSSKAGILCATNAFGMGVDKKDVRSVIHFNISRSIEAFLQESGRGGRDTAPAYSVVLYDARDRTAAGGDSKNTGTSRCGRLLAALSRREKCVRNGLMEAMGMQAVFCNGCDVCNQSRPQQPAGSRAIIDFFSVYPGRYSCKAAADILSGRYCRSEVEQGHRHVFGFASMQNWRKSEIRAAIECLLESGLLKQPRGFRRRGCIRPCKEASRIQRLS